MAGKRRDKLVEVFLSNPDLMRLPDAAVVQAKWNAALRLETLRAYPPMKPEEAAELLSASADEVPSTWRHWADEGRIFSVPHQGMVLYPAFQFDSETGEPHAVLHEVLSIFEPEDVHRGWQVYLWLTHAPPALGDRIPADLLSTEPQAVIDAAVAEVQPIDG
jgi:hypothetical protein